MMKSLGMYKCVIIDDEVHALEGLEKYIQKCPELSLIGSYSDPLLALSKLQEFDSIDLIFLDIDMPEINGIELSKLLRPLTCRLIFTTGYTKYGYEAFKVHADDYLLKPYSFIEFVTSINRIFGQSKIPPSESTKEKTFLVKSKEDNLRIFNLKYSEVVAVESKMNYVMIHTFNFLADRLLISSGIIKYIGVYKMDKIFIYKNLFRGVYFLLFSIGYYLFKIREIDRVEKEQLKQMKLELLIKQQQTNQELAEMQNAYLKAQINPHFLFNTLDFVYHSIYTDPEIASDAIIHLSKVMRFAIDSNLNGSLIKLGDEILHTQNLLRLYTMRKPNVLMPKVEYQENIIDVDFIPLVILTLAENMIKHGLFMENSSPSYIKIHSCHEFLIIHTSNPCRINRLQNSIGNGVLNVKKRLQFTYGAKAQLSYEIDHDAKFRVTIKVPLNKLTSFSTLN